MKNSDLSNIVQTRVSQRILVVSVVVIVTTFLNCNEIKKWLSSQKQEPVLRLYESQTSVLYRNVDVATALTAQSTIGIRTSPVGKSQTRYDYSGISDMFVYENGEESLAKMNNVELPVFTFVRDSKNERIVGGSGYLRSHGLMVNNLLSNIRNERITEPGRRKETFTFQETSAFPQSLSYIIDTKPILLKHYGPTLLIFAQSDEFEYSTPGLPAEKIRGVHKVFCVIDRNFENLLLYLSKFEARPSQNTLDESFHVEHAMIQIDSLGTQVNLEAENLDWQPYIEDLTFTNEFKFGSNVKNMFTPNVLPIWAIHTFAVYELSGLASSVAIEGRLNPVILAAIPLYFLAESVVSATTTALYASGIIDWKWDGIANYAGQGIGFAACRAYELLTGNDVDNSEWQFWGGVGADVASIFLLAKAPSSLMGKGIEVSTKGIKIANYVAKPMRGAANVLVGKKLVISKGGISLRRGSTQAVKLGNRLDEIHNKLKNFEIGLKVLDHVRPKGGGETTAQERPRGQKTDILVIFDDSGSMAEPVGTGAETKIEAAKRSFLQVVESSSIGGRWGLVTFNGCTPTIQVPFTNSIETVKNSVLALTPHSSTPIASSLYNALRIVQDDQSVRSCIVILLTDGIETCGGDPLAAARQYKIGSELFIRLISKNTFSLVPSAYAQEIQKPVQLKVIGFGVDPRSQTILQEIAHVSGGSYHGAEDRLSLEKALKSSLRDVDEEPWVNALIILFLLAFLISVIVFVIIIRRRTTIRT